MHFTNSLLVLATASSVAHAFSLAKAVTDGLSNLKRQIAPAPLSQGSGGGSGGGGGSGSECPAIWTEVIPVLQAAFTNTTTGQCTSLARQAVRMGFHDCGSWTISDGFGPDAGGCDGSLILANELARPENLGMQELGLFLQGVTAQFDNQIGTADLIQMSAATAIVTCPGGPQIQVFVGRPDSSTPSPFGLLPMPNQTAPDLFNQFVQKGFSALQLAALLGAHTVAQQFFVNPALAGQPLDDTDGLWDVHFYTDIFNPPEGIFQLQSDVVLSTFEEVGQGFSGFVDNQGKWEGEFSTAMTQMSLNGIAGGSEALIECTSALPAPTTNQFGAKKTKTRRRAGPINKK